VFNRLSGVLVLLLVGGLYALPVRAGCISDCKDEYESDVQDCSLTNDQSEDAATLKMCLDEAQDDYRDCAQECKS